jgi:phage terminase large subunit-like protein
VWQLVVIAFWHACHRYGRFLVSVLVNVLFGFAVMLRSVANMRGDLAGRLDEVRAPCQAVVEADGYSVEPWLPQDPGQAGLDRGQSYIRAMPGDPIECERMTGSKEARAHAGACQVDIGAVRILRAPWARHIGPTIQAVALYDYTTGCDLRAGSLRDCQPGAQ